MYRMYRITCEPYFMIPMIMMQQGRHAVARQRLVETALNSGNSVITRGEAFVGSPLARLRYELRDLALTARLAQRARLKWRFLEGVRRAFEKIRVSPGDSAYSSYYSDKNEAFSTVPSAEWTSKQHFVRDTLVELEPSTVLDFGSNTGWFSILAARLGASVVAVDVDEASIDTLYRSARRDKLDILPLVANLADPVADLPSATFDDEPVLSRIGGDPPLYPSPLSRLGCEMVMALAIVHHLVLGQGLTFEKVVELLGGLAERHLCIEFVDISDEMIVSDPGFFPALQAAPRSFEWYTLDNLTAHLRREFREVAVRPSHPSTRSLLVCSR
jgi:hypothetical protein